MLVRMCICVKFMNIHMHIHILTWMSRNEWPSNCVALHSIFRGFVETIAFLIGPNHNNYFTTQDFPELKGTSLPPLPIKGCGRVMSL